MKAPRTFCAWLKMLVVTSLAGVGQAGTTWLSCAGVKQAGIDMPDLNLKVLGVMCATAVAGNVFFYLKQLPDVGKDDDGNTVVITNKITAGPKP